MVVRPFCGLRYDLGRVGDLNRVIAPPYDVIGEEEQEQLYQVSPYNIVRLILGRQSAKDTDQDNRYTRAQRDFNSWRQSGILKCDAKPSLYLIEHSFVHAGTSRARLGFIGLLELRDALNGAVYRHEATLAAPKADRTKLLDAVPANLSPIFCIYPDAGAALQHAFQRVTSDVEPIARAMLHGESIRLWALTDPALIEQICRGLSSVAVLIADGHHRFEVAYARRDRYDALMSYFVSMEDPGLIVRAIHRVVARSSAEHLSKLRQLCQVEPMKELAALLQWLETGTGRGRFGYSDGQALYGVTLNSERMAQWLMAPPVALPLAMLDVSLLHGLLLPQLGLRSSPTTPEGESEIRYTADASEALRMANGGGCAAWFLRPIPLSQIYALASQGMSLSPKSTYFYPKVPSGLTINPLA